MRELSHKEIVGIVAVSFCLLVYGLTMLYNERLNMMTSRGYTQMMLPNMYLKTWVLTEYKK